MTGHAKLRIAVGIFHDVTRLRDALDGLAASGCSGDDIVLLYDAGAMDGRLEEQLANIEQTITGSIQRLMRSSGRTKPEQSRVKHPALTRDQIPHFEIWLPSQYARKLGDHLRHSGCVLFCNALSEIQEQAIARVLLRHSADPVQFHDLPAAG